MFLPPFIACPERSEGGAGGQNIRSGMNCRGKMGDIGAASKRLFEIK